MSPNHGGRRLSSQSQQYGMTRRSPRWSKPILDIQTMTSQKVLQPKSFDPNVTAARLSLLTTSLKELYNDPIYYDLIIRSESGQMWRCHKLVVCTQSEVMQRTIETGAMLQSIAEKNEILLDDDATVITSMVQYLYTGDYHDIVSETAIVGTSLLHSIHMVTIADKYMITPLVDLAVEKFRACCASHWFRPVFAQAVREVFLDAPAFDMRLRTAVLQTIHEASTTLFAVENAGQFAEFLAVVDEVPGLGVEIARRAYTGGA